MERDFKGVWIPSNIWLDSNIGWSEKLLLVEIESLSVLEKGCFATNDYFGKFFGLSKDRISKIISSLKNKGYIEVKLIYNKDSKCIDKRLITTRGYKLKQLEGIVENNDRGIVENNEDNNTSFINTNNNTIILDRNLLNDFINEVISITSNSLISVEKAIKKSEIINMPNNTMKKCLENITNPNEFLKKVHLNFFTKEINIEDIANGKYLGEVKNENKIVKKKLTQEQEELIRKYS